MALAPGYGETPVPDEDLDALLPDVLEVLGEPISKAAVYDLEQAVYRQVGEELLTAVIDGAVPLKELLADHFSRQLHRRLYGDIWTWGGVFRKREMNIGVAPEQIAVELRGSLETIQYRWGHTEDWTARELGIVAHAETVRIHPFADGNGRATRLLADLVFVAAQEDETLELYDWDLDKRRYIDLLRQFDEHRDPRELAAFVGTRPLKM